MLKRFFLFLFVAAFAATLGYAQKSTLTIPVGKTRADNGRQMYNSYCAQCHGVDGRGNGATAAALKTPPADLTTLSMNNHGVYPATHVVAVLHFGVDAPAHGSKEMPVWGPVLNKLDHPSGAGDTAALRINNLVSYIETLQAK